MRLNLPCSEKTVEKDSSTRTVRRGCPVNRLAEDPVSTIECTTSGEPSIAVSISIVVPCRNETKAIHAFLNSLLSQDLRNFNWEAIIADGMSDDGTRKVLQQFSSEHPQVRMIDNPSHIVSTGLNACIREAKGDIIVRMDVHTEYKADYVRRCLEVLQRTNAANVGGACIALQTGFIGRAIAGAFHSPFAVGGARWHQPTYEGPVDTVHLGCWRREVLEQIGYFDEALVRNQDDELNFRLTRAGGTVWQSPEIVSWYHPRSSLGALFRQYFQYGFWKVAVIKKHRLPASWRHLVPGAFVLANLAVLAAGILRDHIRTRAILLVHGRGTGHGHRVCGGRIRRCMLRCKERRLDTLPLTSTGIQFLPCCLWTWFPVRHLLFLNHASQGPLRRDCFHRAYSMKESRRCCQSPVDSTQSTITTHT